MPLIQENVNKKQLVKAIVGYTGLSYEDIGRRCSPPVSDAAVHKTLHGKLNGDRLITEIATILQPFIEDLLINLTDVKSNPRALFQGRVTNQDTDTTGENREAVPGIGGSIDD